MLNARYNHCMVYDEKRSRIFCFGGINDITPNKLSGLETTQDHDEDEEEGFLRSSEYYDMTNDAWYKTAKMPRHRE